MTKFMDKMDKVMDSTTLFSLIITFGAFGAISALVACIIMMLTAA